MHYYQKTYFYFFLLRKNISNKFLSTDRCFEKSYIDKHRDDHPKIYLSKSLSNTENILHYRERLCC